MSDTSLQNDMNERVTRLEVELAAQRVEINALQTALGANPAAAPGAGWLPPRKVARELQRHDVIAFGGTPSGWAAAEPVSTSPTAPPLESRNPTPVPSFGLPEPSKPRRSLEDRLGAQIFQRIGIIALLVGVAAFLKYAMDNHWIHPTPIGRVVTGVVAGAGIVLWSERFRSRGLAAFSYALKAVGTGTLYLSLWAAFHLYHLLPAAAALGLMCAVTVWIAAMAWLQDAELLAVYALAGAFATPAMIGSGGNHEGFLFIYVLAVDAAVLWLVAKKPWQRLLLGTFPATVLFFVAWYAEWFDRNPVLRARPAVETSIFALLLSACFALTAFLGRQREGVIEGLLAPLGAAVFAALALYSVLEDSGRHTWLPWAAVLLAAGYVLLARLKRGGLVEALHTSVAVTLLTIAVPLKASGHWLALGWLVEAIALLWIATRVIDMQPRVRSTMRWLGFGSLALGVGGAALRMCTDTPTTAFANKRFVVALCAVGSLALVAWLARTRNNAVEPEADSRLGWKGLTRVSMVLANIFGIVGLLVELDTFWAQRALGGHQHELSTLTCACLLGSYAVAVRWWQRTLPEEDVLFDVLCGVALVSAVFLSLTAAFESVQKPSLAVLTLRLFFEAVCAATMATAALQQWQSQHRAGLSSEQIITRRKIAAGILVAFNLVIIVDGLREIGAHFAFAATDTAGLATGLSISAWLMLCAAAMLLAGFLKRSSFVRWQGLGLLLFTIGKVFLYDMRNLSAGYRVLSLIGLGVVLMTVSYAYQRNWLELKSQTGEVQA